MEEAERAVLSRLQVEALEQKDIVVALKAADMTLDERAASRETCDRDGEREGDREDEVTHVYFPFRSAFHTGLSFWTACCEISSAMSSARSARSARAARW